MGKRRLALLCFKRRRGRRGFIVSYIFNILLGEFTDRTAWTMSQEPDEILIGSANIQAEGNNIIKIQYFFMCAFTIHAGDILGEVEQ